MNKTETVKILSVLKVAYPNFYKGLTPEEGRAVINVWSTQLSGVPYDIVGMAINKIIAVSAFPPTIAEVKKKLSGMYCEAVGSLLDGSNNEVTKDGLIRIVEYCRDIEKEPELTALIGFSHQGGKTIETHDMQQGSLPIL